MRMMWETLEYLMAPMLKIGQLASQSGLSRDTIRFYEREALLPPPQRTPAGYRLYTHEVVARLAFIKHAQTLGFSLREIRELLDGYHDESECRHVAALLRHQMAELDQKMQQMQALRSLLRTYLAACTTALSNGRAHQGCPVLCDIAPHPSHQEDAQP